MSAVSRKPFRLKSPEPTEAMVLSDVLSCLKQLQALGKITRFWRNNTGAYEIGVGRARRYVKFGEKGSPDILGFLPDGKFFGLEVKKPSGKLTPEQADFIELAVSTGAMCGVCRSIDDVLSMFGVKHASSN